MNPGKLELNRWFLIIALMGLVVEPASAQTVPMISPALDGTGTVVSPTGNQFDIQGGTLSGDGGNLFHSFQQFGLSEGQIANFLSTPSIRNILGRVMGGEASYINGLIQVTGGSPNLFLMNPSGFILGAGASLNVPASFTLTTAKGIGFENQQWFSATGINDYQTLVGTPNTFDFSALSSGSIINQGHLQVNPGQSLTLLAGNVINTGTLVAPGGNITVAAVPGENIVRISQVGNLLSLEVATADQGSGETTAISEMTPLSLPALLTGGEESGSATDVSVINGQIVLQGAGTIIPEIPGTTVIQGIISVAVPQVLDNGNGVGGNIGIFGNLVGLVDATVQADGIFGGGTIYIGGTERGAEAGIQAQRTMINPGTLISANAGESGNGGRIVVWSDYTTQFHGQIQARGGNLLGNGGFAEVSGKQNLVFRGEVDLRATQGNLGTLLLDPENITIVNGSGGVDDQGLETDQPLAGDPEGQILMAEGAGTFTLSEITLENLSGNADVILEATNNITIEDLSDNELTFAAGTGNITLTADADGNGAGVFSMNSEDGIRAPGRNLTISGAGITTGTLDTSSDGVEDGGNITLIATDGVIDSSGGTLNSSSYDGKGGIVSLTADGNIITSEINTSSLGYSQEGGAIILESVNGFIDTTDGILNSNSDFDGAGGNIQLTAFGNISTADIQSSGYIGGGSIALESLNGEINTGAGILNSNSNQGNGGEVSLAASGNITTATINTSGFGTLGGDAGNITLNSLGGEIDTGAGTLNSSSYDGKGGIVSLTADGNIITSEINTSSLGYSQEGGAIILESVNGFIDTTDGILNSNSDFDGAGGNIQLTAFGNISTADIQSSGYIGGGSIALESLNGEINTGAGILNSNSNQGNGGEVSLAASGNITTATINTSGFGTLGGDAGNITLNSLGGEIDTGAGTLNSSSYDGKGGIVSLTADGNIITSEINTSSLGYSQEGGAIILESVNGFIDTTSGVINSSASFDGNGGQIELTADGNITTGDLTSSGYLSGGNIIVKSFNGDIDTTAGAIDADVVVGYPGDLDFSAQNGSIILGSYVSNGSSYLGVPSPLDPNSVADFSGTIILEAFNDITINEVIDAFESIKIIAGRSILINADINTASANGNIVVQANNATAADGNRAPGTADLTQSPGTTLNAGSGNILLELGNAGERGTLTVGTLETTGTLVITAGGGNIQLAEDNALLTAGSAIFHTLNEGGIGTASHPIRISVSNLEAVTGSGGAFFNSPNNITIGEVSSTLNGIEAYNGGEIIIEAAGDITLLEGISRNAFFGDAGNVTLRSEGAIQAGGTLIQSSSNDGAGGTVTLEAVGDIITGQVISQGAMQSGDINIISTHGKINTTEIDNPQPGNANIDSYSSSGIGGNVTISAYGDIITHQIISEGAQESGNISVTSENGNITTSLNDNIYGNLHISAYSVDGIGGEVALEAKGNILTGQISSQGWLDSGNINLTSLMGSIDTTSPGNSSSGFVNLNSYSSNGTGGSITLSAQGDINTGAITTLGQEAGGNITLLSQDGSINTTDSGLGEVTSLLEPDADITAPEVANLFQSAYANLDSYSWSGTGGTVTLSAKNNLTTGDISSFGPQGAGDVSLSSLMGNIDTGVIFSVSEQGQGGQITIDAENGGVNINHIATYSTHNIGGDITIHTGNSVTLNNIASFGNAGSGDVYVQTTEGGIATGFIKTIAPSGASGNITLNTFSVNGDIVTADISSVGSEASGDITVDAVDGNVTVNGDIISLSENGDAGNIVVSGGLNVSTGNISSIGGNNSGNISVTSTTGTVTTGNLESRADTGTAGNITVTAEQNVTTGDITTTGATGSGNITITSQEGEVNTGTPFTDTGTLEINSGIPQDLPMTPAEDIPSQIPETMEPEASRMVTEMPVISPTDNPIAVTATPLIVQPAPAPLLETLLPITLPALEMPLEVPGVAPVSPPSLSIEPVISDLFSPINLPLSGIATETPPVRQIISQTPQTNRSLPDNPRLIRSQVLPTEFVRITQQNPELITTLASVINNSPLSQIRDNHRNLPVDTQRLNPEVSPTLNHNSIGSLSVSVSLDAISVLEQNRQDEFSNYLGGDQDWKHQLASASNIRQALVNIAQETGHQSAIIYVNILPNALQLHLFLPQGNATSTTVPGIGKEELLKTVTELRDTLTNPRHRRSQPYLKPSQQLYQWLIAPIEAQLADADIDTLLFSMDTGLRGLPIAALHDGNQFLVEKYSLSLIPSVNLIDTRYRPLQNTQVLAMGASDFDTGLSPLPGVPVELQTITGQLWQGATFLNEDFTRQNLVEERQRYPYPIIHLATHSAFNPGNLNNSYIQLWDSRLGLNELRQLGLNNPAVELLVLSSCQTALGSEDAELGFAGFAVAAGVKSALASLWQVSDGGTLALMTEFYTHLQHSKIKAEALRQAQIAMINGEVTVSDGELRGSGSTRGGVQLPSSLASLEDTNLSHPYYWSGFTLIGSPW